MLLLMLRISVQRPGAMALCWALRHYAFPNGTTCLYMAADGVVGCTHLVSEDGDSTTGGSVAGHLDAGFGTLGHQLVA